MHRPGLMHGKIGTGQEICRRESEEMQKIVKKSDRTVLKSVTLRDVISKEQMELVCEGCLLEALKKLAFYMDRVILGIVGTVTQSRVSVSFLA